ncbi:MAG: response regulator transcription factor [Propioniciclava sp.]|uniref:response regulator transcription factor n=1 Tax=Propioniciclava sp. TaxID=2038686 RepID=UPI0039E2B9A0
MNAPQSSERPTRIIVVEDQTILRESLVAAIDGEPDLEVIASLADAADAVELAERLRPDLMLMDVYTDHGSSGIVAARRIKASQPGVYVVIMTGMPEITFVRQARDAGADSFIYKNVGTGELLGVLRSTRDGYSTYPRDTIPTRFGAAGLTDDEIEILRLACEAKSRKEIAAELYLSEGTVKRRISEMLAKTGYDHILNLAVDAVSDGYIAPRIERER